MTAADQEKIYTGYHSKVMGYLCSKLNDQMLSEELCEDIFLKIYERISQFDETKASLSTWIFTITRNTLTDYYRTRRFFSEIPETMDDGSCLEEEYCNREELNLLAEALASLEPRLRDIIILHYYSGLTLKEVGMRMGFSYAYIKTLHNKAISQLRTKLS